MNVVAADPKRRTLLRVLGSWEGAAIGIGVAIGAGIFRTPGYVAGFLDAPWKVVAVWVLGGLLVLGDSLVLSELASRIPKAGGWYIYIEKGWGRFPAFVYGWVYTLIIDPASSAALVVVLGEYLGRLLGVDGAAARILAIAGTLALFGFSLAGIRVGSRLQDALTYTKLLALVAVGVLALLLPAPSGAGPSSPAKASGLLAMGLALQGVLWTFEGYANTTTMTEESKNPLKTLPRALIAGSVALGLTYLLVNVAYLHVLGRDALARSEIPAADVAARLFGSQGHNAFLALAVFTALGSLNGAVLSAPRVVYALARSELAPSILTRVTRLGTPDAATLWFALAWTAYAWFGSFEGLVSVSVFIGALANVAVTASLFRHRHLKTGEAAPAAGPPQEPPAGGPRRQSAPKAFGMEPSARPGGEVFQCPGYPVLPCLVLAAWIGFSAAVLIGEGPRVLYGLGITVLAAPAYLWWTKRRERTAASPG